MPPVASPEPAREGPLTIYAVPTERHAESGPIPVPRTSFVGREHEVGQVTTLLSQPEIRLVTLTGPGGVGKTRIAIRAVSSAAQPAHFVDLADVRQPALVLPAIAAALGVRSDGRPVLDYLRAVLRNDPYLLVLDNLEQVLPAAASLAALLDACPHITLLATSRAVLGIPGEHVVDIRPFPLPPARTPHAGTRAEELDACRLFVDRARALDPAFTLTGANEGAIVGICQRLDGLPLAIELAASWIPVLAPATLLAQLERRLALPGSGSPGAPPRQRSLRDTIAWSYGLLGPSTQALFRRLAVFNGGCTLDAVEEVCGNDVLPELRALVANSLVRRTDPATSESRYTMLETVREFGLECLQHSGEADAIHRRHARSILALAERVEANLDTVERETWLDLLEAEQGNLHAALAWSLEREEAEIAVALCGALLPFWQFRFHSGIGREWVRRALALAKPVSAAAMRKAVSCAGTLAYMHGDHAEAATRFADALLRYEDAGDPVMTARIEIALGRLAWDDDDLATARTWFDAATRRFGQAGDEAGLAQALHYLGLLAFKESRYPEAERYLNDALARWRALGFTWELARCIPGHLADVARAEGNLTGAVAHYQQCLSLNWERQDLENVSWSLAGLAMIAAADGQVEQAVRLITLAGRFEERTGAPLTPHIRRDHDRALGTLVERAGPQRFAALQAAAKTADPASEIADALTLARPAASPAAPAGSRLTTRERDVLRLMAAGHSNQEIADALYVTVGTVKVHVTHILAKLDLKSRSAATDYAHRHGLA